MKTCCLLGNGVSIAYSADLSVPALTDALLQRLQELGGGQAGETLARFASEVAAKPGATFEPLLGPLSATAAALDNIAELAPLAHHSGRIEDGIETVSTFLRDVHRLGLGTVLGLIAERSTGHPGSFGKVPAALASALIGLGDACDLSVATLNYDGLTHAGLMDEGADEWGREVFKIADLADGRLADAHVLVDGERPLVGNPLRADDDLPEDRADLVHLHGYLGWLRDTSTGWVWKFRLQDLREIGFWAALAEGRTGWEPMVVLTDRKTRATLAPPFSLAYAIFRQRLIAADRWLVVGYGLGDEPVNEAFMAASQTRAHLDLPEPLVMVLDSREDPNSFRSEALRRLCLPQAAIINVSGVPEAFTSREWGAFAGL